MKILDVTMVTDSKQFFPKEGTLVFLQDAYKEQLSNLAQSLINGLGNAYSSSTVYVLWGCVNSGSGSNFIISAGAVFYNGEIFSVDAVSLTVSGGNIPVANIVTTQYTVNADPVTFSDSTTANIHNIRKVSIGSGTAGSGISNYTDLVALNFVTPSQVLTLTNTTAFTPTADYQPATKKYVDSNGVQILAKGYTPLGAIPSGTQNYVIPLGTTVGVNYKVVASVVNNNGSNAECSWYIDNTYSSKTTGFKLYIHCTGSTSADIYFDWFVIAR
ncbi:hypothetical protein UFOVP129_38 [uncultured Caudovirales phage]|uniref:Uncharacterized protein n=1 Tax=uncultured Caudovirales phage TaxID=2100421 RepID=A0A6J5LCQ6_9CAUD|nr:hypothetical protein UFOVP129_38 [uncultured Caudovirales phage]